MPGGLEYSLNIGGIRSERQLFSYFAAELAFPDYFGHNWDALDECMRDLSWVRDDVCAGDHKGGGHVRIAIAGCDRLKEKQPRLWNVLSGAIELWMDHWENIEPEAGVEIMLV